VWKIELAMVKNPSELSTILNCKVCQRPKPRLLPRLPLRWCTPRINRVPPNKSSDDSSDDSTDIFTAFRTPLNPVPKTLANPVSI